MGKGGQIFRPSNHAHFAMRPAFYCKRIASRLQFMGDTNCTISPFWKWILKFLLVRLLVFAHSACRYKVLCEVLPRAVNIKFIVSQCMDFWLQLLFYVSRRGKLKWCHKMSHLLLDFRCCQFRTCCSWLRLLLSCSAATKICQTLVTPSHVLITKTGMAKQATPTKN